MTAALHPRGQFGNKPLVGACPVTPGAMLPTESYGPGTVFAQHAVNGGFRGADGTIYSIMWRNIGVLGANEIQVFSNRGGRDRLEPVEEFNDAFSGLLVHVPIENGLSLQGFAVPPARSAQSFELTMTGEGSSWTEGDLLSLRGRYVGNCGLQWLTPIDNGAHLQIYQMQRASGTILGEHVEGFYDVAGIYSPPGTTYYSTLAGQYQTWLSFGNEYDDGGLEVGQVCASEGDWSFALIANQDGPAVLTTNVTAKSTFDEHGWPERTVYDIDGELWEWTADDRARLWRGSSFEIPINQAEGQLRRVNDRREIVACFGNNAANNTMPAL